MKIKVTQLKSGKFQQANEIKFTTKKGKEIAIRLIADSKTNNIKQVQYRVDNKASHIAVVNNNVQLAWNQMEKEVSKIK